MNRRAQVGVLCGLVLLFTAAFALAQCGRVRPHIQHPVFDRIDLAYRGFMIDT